MRIFRIKKKITKTFWNWIFIDYFLFLDCCLWWFHWSTICNTFCQPFQLHDLSLYYVAMIYSLIYFISFYFFLCLNYYCVYHYCLFKGCCCRFVISSLYWMKKEHTHTYTDLIDLKRKTNPKNKTIVNINELTQDEIKNAVQLNIMTLR